MHGRAGAGVFACLPPLTGQEVDAHFLITSMNDAYEETPGGAAGSSSSASAGAMLRIKVKTMEPATYELSARKNVRSLPRIAPS